MDVANEILDAIEIVADKKIREQTTQIYPGICKSVNGNSCVMSINGKDNTVQFYGSAPNVGAIYRVFVPYGNMSMAFIITTNGGGSSAFGVSSVNGLTGDVNLTASDVGAAPAGFGLGELVGKTINTLDEIDGFGFYRIPTDSGVAPDTSTNWGAIFVGSNINYGTLIASRAGGLIATRTKIGVWADSWEWVNPPMELGVEYRTTERYNGKPVYMKAVSCGYMANNKTVDVLTNDYRAISAVLKGSPTLFPMVPRGTSLSGWQGGFMLDGTQITLYAGTSLADSNHSVVAIIKFIEA